MLAFIAELRAMLDRNRVVAILCIVAGAAVLAALPTGSSGVAMGEGAWIIVVGITLSTGWQVYSRRRDAGRPDPGRWGLAAAVGLLLGIGAFLAAMMLLGPVVAASPGLSSNPVPIAATAWALLTLGAVLWARGRQQRTTTLALAVSMGTILGGVAALRAGGSWTPVAFIALLAGLGVFTAAVVPSYRARFGGGTPARPLPARVATPTRATGQPRAARTGAAPEAARPPVGAEEDGRAPVRRAPASVKRRRRHP